MELQACLRAGSVRPLFRGFHLTFVRIGEIFTLRRGRSFFVLLVPLPLFPLLCALSAPLPSRSCASAPSRSLPSLRRCLRSLRFAASAPLPPLRCLRARCLRSLRFAAFAPAAFAPSASLPSLPALRCLRFAAGFAPLPSRPRVRSLRSAGFAFAPSALSRSLPPLRNLRARSLRALALAPSAPQPSRSRVRSLRFAAAFVSPAPFALSRSLPPLRCLRSAVFALSRLPAPRRVVASRPVRSVRPVRPVRPVRRVRPVFGSRYAASPLRVAQKFPARLRSAGFVSLPSHWRLCRHLKSTYLTPWSERSGDRVRVAQKSQNSRG